MVFVIQRVEPLFEVLVLRVEVRELGHPID
jgi:hypothetical protein